MRQLTSKKVSFRGSTHMHQTLHFFFFSVIQDAAFGILKRNNFLFFNFNILFYVLMNASVQCTCSIEGGGGEGGEKLGELLEGPNSFLVDSLSLFFFLSFQSIPPVPSTHTRLLSGQDQKKKKPTIFPNHSNFFYSTPLCLSLFPNILNSFFLIITEGQKKNYS